MGDERFDIAIPFLTGDHPDNKRAYQQDDGSIQGHFPPGGSWRLGGTSLSPMGQKQRDGDGGCFHRGGGGDHDARKGNASRIQGGCSGNEGDNGDGPVMRRDCCRIDL